MPKIERICQQCGKVFYCNQSDVKRGRKYCSKKCASERGKNKYLKKVCPQCGSVFYVEPCYKYRIYCNIECFHEYYRKLLKCKMCGKEFKNSKSRIRMFCSHKCSALWNSGEKSREWKGGHKESLKRQQIARDTLKGGTADCYLKSLIVENMRTKINIKISTKDIPPDLVEVKRAELKLTREIKNERESSITAGERS